MKRYTWLIILTIATSIITLLLVSYLDRRNYAATTSSSIFVFEIDTKTHYIVLENNDLRVYLSDDNFIQERLDETKRNNLSGKFISLENTSALVPGTQCSVLILEYTKDKALSNAFCKTTFEYNSRNQNY